VRIGIAGNHGAGKTILAKALRNITALKDESLPRHQAGVASYAELIAGMICPTISHIVVFAARYHDTGKIGVPDGVLLKPGPLDDREWVLMRQHPVVGAELIEKDNGGMGLNGDLDLDMEVAVKAIRHHHERWDGKGYPDGLNGNDISLAARIIAVADAFDAMTTDRPYRGAVSRKEAIGEIVRCAGTQFDPVVVEAFVKVVG
jgi:putative two-component system response regulator